MQNWNYVNGNEKIFDKITSVFMFHDLKYCTLLLTKVFIITILCFFLSEFNCSLRTWKVVHPVYADELPSLEELEKIGRSKLEKDRIGSFLRFYMAILPLLTLLGFNFIFGALLMSIAKRKGLSELSWFIIGIIPACNILSGLWLASLPDKLILEEVEACSTKLQALDSKSKITDKSFEAELLLSNWECNCGTINDINILNCSECGLKRDYLLKKRLSVKD